MKRLAIFGSTGSIGTSTLRVVSHFPDDFSVEALAANSNINLLTEQIKAFSPELVAVYDHNKAKELQKRFPKQKIVSGDEGLQEMASLESVDFIVMAIVGMMALRPTIAAIKSGKTIGIASKEVFVSAGEYIKKLSSQYNSTILPIDSEHSAIFQCLNGQNNSNLHRIILTASGGPFFRFPKEKLSTVTVKEALSHPTWKMGPKISVDSSTMLNKGLEIIEARWLFNIPPEKIEIVIHPQSIIHSLVEFVDGSMIAQLSHTDMMYPIQYALTYPERKKSIRPFFDWTKNGHFDFFPPDYDKFPAINLAKEVLKVGGSAPCFMNAANEVLVARFLNEEISWLDIINKLSYLLSHYNVINIDNIDTIFHVDHEAREKALNE